MGPAMRSQLLLKKPSSHIFHRRISWKPLQRHILPGSRGWKISAWRRINRNCWWNKSSNFAMKPWSYEEKLERYTVYIYYYYLQEFFPQHIQTMFHIMFHPFWARRPTKYQQSRGEKTRLPSGGPFQRVCWSNPEGKSHFFFRSWVLPMWKQQLKTITGWWFQHIWKSEIFPKVRGEHKNYLKPPPKILKYNKSIINLFESVLLLSNRTIFPRE